MAVRIGELLLKEKRILRSTQEPELSKGPWGKLGFNLVERRVRQGRRAHCAPHNQSGVPRSISRHFGDPAVIKLIPAETAQKSPSFVEPIGARHDTRLHRRPTVRHGRQNSLRAKLRAAWRRRPRRRLHTRAYAMAKRRRRAAVGSGPWAARARSIGTRRGGDVGLRRRRRRSSGRLEEISAESLERRAAKLQSQSSSRRFDVGHKRRERTFT